MYFNRKEPPSGSVNKLLLLFIIIIIIIIILENLKLRNIDSVRAFHNNVYRVYLPVRRILDALSCIPDSKAPDFGFHKQMFLGFRIP